jgi:hypothetical protein
MSRRDLLDRAQPQDIEKSPDLARQEQAGFRPEAAQETHEADKGSKTAAPPSPGGDASKASKTSDAERQRLNPKRERAAFRPRDEGGSTPSPSGKSH